VSDQYPAKLLLFGEYTVLNGSQALSVPFQKFSGKWVKQNDSGQMSLIPEYFRWLQKVEIADDAKFEHIVKEYNEGWTFDSTIPVGYGMGSSGAYVAALYDRYFNDHPEDIEKTTSELARMESYFHGSSSGMDPLVSYTGKAVYKDERVNFI
jgi:mevalonate kinase